MIERTRNIILLPIAMIMTAIGFAYTISVILPIIDYIIRKRKSGIFLLLADEGLEF